MSCSIWRALQPTSGATPCLDHRSSSGPASDFKQVIDPVSLSILIFEMGIIILPFSQAQTGKPKAFWNLDRTGCRARAPCCLSGFKINQRAGQSVPAARCAA